MNFFKTALFASITALTTFTLAAHAGSKTKVIWIEEPDTDSHKVKDLRGRISRLERAVAQLQHRIFELEYKDISSNDPQAKDPSFTCYIETPFEGLFSVTKPSKTEAKAAVAAECSQKTKNSLYCKIEKATCGE